MATLYKALQSSTANAMSLTPSPWSVWCAPISTEGNYGKLKEYAPLISELNFAQCTFIAGIERRFENKDDLLWEERERERESGITLAANSIVVLREQRGKNDVQYCNHSLMYMYCTYYTVCS